MAARKLRILCLHGYHGSADVLRGQIAPLRETLDARADLVFVDAPSRAEGDFGWWHAVKDQRASSVEDPGVGGPGKHYKGWERTRTAILSIFEENGPFDGVFGFSQGAALTGLLVGLRATTTTPFGIDRPLRFDFAVMVGGFSSNDPELARLYENNDAYALPSLHICGRSDTIVPIDVSRTLAQRFTNAAVVEHAGGHVIPRDAEVVTQLRAFLEARTTNDR